MTDFVNTYYYWQDDYSQNTYLIFLTLQLLNKSAQKNIINKLLLYSISLDI